METAKSSTWVDPILEQWDAGIDVSQIEENLRLSPEQRLEKMLAFVRFLEGFDGAKPLKPAKE